MIWIHYSTLDGAICGTLYQPMTGGDYDAFKTNGFDQMQYPNELEGDLSQYNVDITQNPHVLILRGGQ